MTFSEWLDKKLKQEVATSAGGAGATVASNIAGYPRPLFMVARGDFFPRKKKISLSTI